MPDANTLGLLAQGGSTAILLVVLYLLWNEYKVQSAYIRDRLDKSDAERLVLAEKLGMSSQELRTQADAKLLNKSG